MILTLLILRWIGVAAWLVVLWRLHRPTIRAFGPAPFQFDPFWALISLLVLNRLAYQGAGLIFVNPPDTQVEAWWRLFLQLWSIGMAVVILFLKHWYRVTPDA